MERSLVEERLALALDAASASTWDHDVPGRCVHLDARWGDIIGSEPRERTVATRRLFALVHPADRAQAIAPIRACYLGRASQFRVEYRVRHARGEWIWLLCQGRVVERDAAGRTRRMIGINTDITDQKLAEERLRRHVQFLTQIQTSTVDFLESPDQAALLRAIVHRAEALFGAQGATLALLEGSELVYRACTPGAAFLQGRRLDRSQPLLSWRAIDTREPVAVEDYSTHPDRVRSPGSLTLQACAVFPIMTGDVVLGVIGISRDTPGQVYTPDELQMGRLFAQIAALLFRNAGICDDAVRLAEARHAALRESEGKFRGVFDHSPVSISLLTVPEGRIIEINTAAEEAFGFSRAEVVGKTTSELGIWTDLRDRERYLELLRTQGSVEGLEARMHRRNGSTFAALFSASVVTLGGRPYTLNLLQDITARKETEEARDRLLAQVQATLESTTDGILVVDSAGRIQSFNRLFAEMWHAPAEILATRNDEAALQHALGQLLDPEAFLAQVRALYSQPTAESFDTLHFKDGRTFERYSRPQLVNGLPAGRVWSFRDVSTRVRAEEQRALLEASLRESRKMESLGTLAGGVAHDFNNFLGGMCGYVEIAQERLPPEHPARLLLGQTLDLGQRARELVRQILTFSRRTISEYRPLDLSSVVAEALNLSRLTLPAGAELQTALATDCPPVAADSTQIHQVVLNLCTNASHALPAIGGRITVTVAPAILPARFAATQPALAAGPVVRLSVADNGCGMNAATVERIFEPFFTTKESGKGTGLGLSVVHGIVGAHDGAIDVRSQPGAGTTFDIYLPALAVTPAAQSTTPEAEPPQGHHEPILWVDDNPATGSVIEHLLGRLDYQVTHLTSAEEALARFTAAPDAFAMVITDLIMPGLGGGELAKAVLQLRPNLPVLLVTGMIEPEQQAALLEAGIREVVFKPVTRAELAHVVARHLPAGGSKV